MVGQTCRFAAAPSRAPPTISEMTFGNHSMRSELSTVGGLKIRDTAECNSALRENSDHSGREVARDEPTQHRPQPEFRQVRPPFRHECPDAADLDGNAGKVREAAQRVSRQLDTPG